ncbi:MAG: hypothetical protein ACJ74Q_04495 [Pyrinomonadaceae bacterium]
MERPPDSLKAFANRIAETVQSNDTALTLRLLRLSGLLGTQPDGDPRKSSAAGVVGDADVDTHPAPNPNHIGIWERREENGKTSFVRRMEIIEEWDYWSPNLGRIEAKGSKLRVVLIGESVARGYLYDPAFTPAMALEMILGPRFGKDEIEIIDLARTNLSCAMLRDVATNALLLEPDVTIIYAGNNWGATFPGPAGIAGLDEAVSKNGIKGAKQVSEKQIRRMARHAVKAVSAAYQSKGVPLVWMIPEFDLGDWRDPVTNAPHLASGLNREWLDLLGEAQGAMRDGDYARAEEMGGRMVEIDEGVSVAGLYVLADCRRHAGDVEGERKHLEAALDVVSWDFSRMVYPRTYSASREVLLDEVPKYPLHQLIDVRALFKEYLGGGIPGRRMFIDYCHLASEGIRVAMAAAASCVLRALKRAEAPWQALVDERVAPPPETEAEASFLAAIHNAHTWQSYDLVRYYCARALKLSPHVAEFMLSFLEIQTRNALPMRMSAAEERITLSASPLMRQYLLRLNEKRLDRMLLGAVTDALAEAGIDARERLERMRREEHSVTQGEVNLLEYYYCSSAEQLQEITWLLSLSSYNEHRPNGAQYYKAYGPASRFYFVGEAGRPVRLSVACRLPQPAPAEASIFVELNARPQVEIVIGGDWSAWEVDVSGEVVRDGLNEVTVRWPMPELASAAALERAVLDLYDRIIPEFYPVFGEIHSFIASDARTAQSQGRTVR